MHSQETVDWRLLVDPPRDGSKNMAIDEALLEHCASEEYAYHFPTVRFYQWSHPTLSLGYNQEVKGSLQLSACRERGIPIVRRPTGGKAVFHDQELTYSVIASFSSHPFRMSVADNYRMISEALTEGLKLLNLEVRIAEEDTPAYSPSGPEACFARLSRYEISCQGFKLVGSAQRRKRKAFLQHGSILLDADRQLVRKLIKSKGSQDKWDFVSVREVLGRSVTFEEMIPLLVRGFEKKFKIRLKASQLSEEEKNMAKGLSMRRTL